MLPTILQLTTLSDEQLLPGLATFGFANPDNGLAALRKIAAHALRSASTDSEVPGWYRTFVRVLREAPMKEAVVLTLARLLESSDDPGDVLKHFERIPRAFDILGRLACGSPFLTQIVLSDPNHLFALADDSRLAEMKSLEQFIEQATRITDSYPTRAARLSSLRRMQRRELLRIGLCDAFGLLDLRFVTLQLSLLADALVQVCLNLATDEVAGASPEKYDATQRASSLAVIALGKLGGEELNYSSDIDLMLVAAESNDTLDRIARLTIDGLADNLAPGFLYRVDLRLRPWGQAGSLVSSVSSTADYFAQDAALWEKQAMLKARVIAGNRTIGQQLLKSVRPLLFTETPDAVRKGVQQMKDRIEARLRQRGRLNSQVKLGVGSIRDVEFLVQALQLIHGESEPRIVISNTLEALVRLAEFGLMPSAWYRQLRAGYVFLRTIEHSLQLSHNLQTHELPADSRQLDWLASRLDYPDAATLLQRYNEHRQAIRTIFDEGLHTSSESDGDGLSRNAGFASHQHELEQTLNSQGDVDSQRLIRRQQVQSLLGQLTAPDELIVAELPLIPGSQVRELLLSGPEFTGWLSVICGLMSILRFDIRDGDALTGEGENRFGVRCPSHRFLACMEVRELDAARTSDASSPLIATLHCEIERLSQLSRSGRVDEVRSELLRRFCDAVPNTQSRPPSASSSMPDVQIEVSRLPDSVLTQVNISGTDSWGFLYELASALSLSRFRVRKAVIASDGDQVRDVLFVRERNGRPIDSEHRLQELTLSATLIKQFMHWLPTTSDPYSALTRFRELLTRLQPAAAWPESMQSLQRPGVLPAVARVLGISQYLWESFLRSQHDQLLPLLANTLLLAQRICREDLALELKAATDNANSFPEAWERLNAFKDRHLFRIDLRHVLGHCRPFGAFSEEVTELAELVVSQAVELSMRQLKVVHGTPCMAGSTRSCDWAIAGLGKFGGVEMGFASDIELMLVYSTAGQTDGRQPVSNAEFFDRVVGLIASGIVAAQDGIFHVDLRMRPFGQAGIGAVSLPDFVRYYAPRGPAWPFERQGLTRFRCVDGQPDFCRAVTDACHRAIYAGTEFDFAAMRAMRERQMRQLVHGGTINAKLSDGGIVDCEYAVQALQLTFGSEHPSLRCPTTLHVLREAVILGLVDADQARSIEGAYVFLRELIDCLRMVRGNARDLTVPAVGSRDWQQLQHRLTMIHDSPIALDQLDNQMQLVRDFSAEVEQRCCK